ncbi:hypothetical protein T484DRAFT_1963803 [Baffinella frigidus]|nr:hypothetical protein T484DRAFT_1963803 [Cryptophyta sp. CCMP2293]
MRAERRMQEETEVIRVRRWSISSDEMAAETMHDLTSAPSILMAGCPFFMNPNDEFKRIHQLPLLCPAVSDGSSRIPRRLQGKAPAVSCYAFPRRLPACHSKILRAPSTTSSVPRASPRNAFPNSTSHRSSQTSFSRAPSTADSFSRASSAASSDGAASSFTIMRSPSDSHTSRSVTGQPRARPFVRSSRFGEPADWPESASLRWQRASRSSSPVGEGGGSSDASERGARVFQPVRPRW